MENRPAHGGFVLAIALITCSLSFGACGGASSSTAPSATTPTAPIPPVTPPSFSFVNANNVPASTPASALPLWGIRGDNSTDFVKQMVFGDASGPSNPGLHSLRRLTGNATLVYNPAQLGDKVAAKVAILQSAAALLQSVVGYQVAVGTVPVPGTVTFSIAFGPTINANGGQFSSNNDATGNIIGGTLTYLDVDHITNYSVRHELGHAFGLFHHNGNGVMAQQSSSFGADGILIYSPSEVDNMTMMLRVASGTLFPGATLSSSSRSSSSFTIP